MVVPTGLCCPKTYLNLRVPERSSKSDEPQNFKTVQAGLLSESSREESASKLIYVVGRIQFLWFYDWVPTSLLAVGPGLISASRGCHQVLAHDTLHLQSQ